MHLPEQTFSMIASLVNKAKIEKERKNYSQALGFYKKAEAAFPQPTEAYTGACFLFYSIAELYFLMNDEIAAAGYLNRAAECPDGVTDDKIWYRFGLLHLQKGDDAAAISDFMKAFAISGKDRFISTNPQEIDFFERHIFNETEVAG
jgi:tetratricopeptide (TPR) repeat protein